MKKGIIYQKHGITLIEIVTGTVIISFIFFMITNFASNMAFQYKHSFVDLENFRIAHQAVNQLRRDYNMACPFITSKDGIEELKRFLGRPLAISKDQGKFVGANRRIRITPRKLTFFKFAEFGFSKSSQPMVEEVEYSFDSKKRQLTRTSAGKTTRFKGFAEVEFKSFVHMGNNLTPVLWVKFVLDNDFYKGNEKPLELTVSIASNFVNDAINHSGWQYRTFHQLN
ncbi:MAG: hypothetical protein ACQES9_10665 [Myxococcota bacterium]